MSMEKDSASKSREDEKDARRKVIVDAAEMEFATKPYSSVNMRDIARRAGISPALIYRYFPDQQSLLFEAFLRGVDTIIEGMYEKIDVNSDEAIRQVASEFVRFFTVNDQYFRMMVNFFLEATIDNEFFQKLIILERNILDFFERILKKLNPSADSRLYSHVLFSSLIGIVMTFRNNPYKSADEIMKHRQRIADILAELFLCNAPR